MRIRIRINFILASLMLAFMLASLTMTLLAARSSVREEQASANAVALGIVQNLVALHANQGREAMLERLRQIGHVRMTSISVLDEAGTLIYTSPPSRSRRDLSTPAWFDPLVSDGAQQSRIRVGTDSIVVRTFAVRALRDGWDDFKRDSLNALAALLVINFVFYWFVGHALHPMSRVIEGLERIAGGDYEVRMPLFRGKEGRLISAAFNHAAQSVAEATEARRQAGEASSKLQMSRDLTREITSHIEEERRSIARELHDELGQSITAIKSVGAALARRAPKDDPVIGAHVQMIIEAADRMYDAVHEMIPRLRPMSLDSFGLSAALSDLVSEWRHRRPEIFFQLAVNEDLPPLQESLSTTAYRIAQESVINAVRHASPEKITVSACIENDRLLLQITDDGMGLDPNWERSGHFGVLGMRERAIALGGSCELTSNAEAGTTVTARLPLLLKH